MNHNIVHKNILKFAIEPVSYNFFIEKLKESRIDNPINCWYTTKEGNNRRYEMWWVPGPVGITEAGDKASLTKEAQGMYNLMGDYDGDWRTLDTETVSRFRYENRTYIVE
jgi:hypothetical protein